MHDLHRERGGAPRELGQQGRVHVHGRHGMSRARQRERHATGAATDLEHGGARCGGSELEPQRQIGAIRAALEVVPDDGLLGRPRGLAVCAPVGGGAAPGTSIAEYPEPSRPL